MKNVQFPGENKRLVNITYCKTEKTVLTLTVIPAVFSHAPPCQRHHGQGLIFLPLWIVFISCVIWRPPVNKSLPSVSLSSHSLYFASTPQVLFTTSFSRPSIFLPGVLFIWGQIRLLTTMVTFIVFIYIQGKRVEVTGPRSHRNGIQTYASTSGFCLLDILLYLLWSDWPPGVPRGPMPACPRLSTGHGRACRDAWTSPGWWGRQPAAQGLRPCHFLPHEFSEPQFPHLWDGNNTGPP